MTYKDSLQYGHFYHLYNRGNNKEALFKEDRNYLYFLDLIKKYIIPIADIYSYCLLPTHFHIMLRIKDDDVIKDYYQNEKRIWLQFRTFLGTYTKTINKMYHRSGHLFEGRFSRRLIHKNDYFFQLILYIHKNPQNYGIVSDYQIWPYSSYQAYINRDERSIISKDVFSDEVLYNTIIEMDINGSKYIKELSFS